MSRLAFVDPLDHREGCDDDSYSLPGIDVESSPESSLAESSLAESSLAESSLAESSLMESPLAESPIVEPVNLVGHWPMETGEGETVFDVSGNEAHGFFQIGAPLWVPGIRGDFALEFDGTTDTGLVQASTGVGGQTVEGGGEWSLDNRYTVSFWFYDLSQTVGLNDAAISFWWPATGAPSPPDNYLALYTSRSNIFIGGPHVSVGGAGVIRGQGLLYNQWVHFVYTRDVNVHRIYINGVLNQEKTFSGPPKRLGRLDIGHFTYILYRGRVDDIRIYDGPLPEAEIQNIFNGVS